MYSVKVSNNNEVRRVQIAVDSANVFGKMQETIRNIFPDLQSKTFSLVWQDEDGDSILVSSDLEMVEAVQVQARSSSTLKFEVRTGVSTAASGIVHTHITCDGCGMSP